MTGQSFKRRARHDIIMEILKSALNGSKKTNIMYKASLSFEQLEQYLNALKKADFITEESGIWKTTEKGHHVIEACRICLHLTDKFAYKKAKAKP
jgi:predicted transcriptional regulator